MTVCMPETSEGLDNTFLTDRDYRKISVFKLINATIVMFYYSNLKWSRVIVSVDDIINCITLCTSLAASGTQGRASPCTNIHWGSFHKDIQAEAKESTNQEYFNG